MANFSVRDLDEETAARLKRVAEERRISVNTLILELIRQGVGIRPQGPRQRVYHDLDQLAGTWTEEEAREFLSMQSDFEQVDADVWK